MSTGQSRTYDFRDITSNKAYEGANVTQPPDSLEIGTEFSSGDYANITYPDNRLTVTSIPDLLEYQRFRFKIFEPIGAISQIGVEHIGYADAGLQLFVWNYGTSSWQFLDENLNLSSPGLSKGSLVEGISKYIDSNGYLNALVQSNAAASSSCPLLYTYDGQKYVFVADLYNRGQLAVPNYLPQPEDFAKIDGDQLAQKNNTYRLQIAQEYDEISYLDKVDLIAIDHTPEVDVFPSLLKADAGKIYTVSKSPKLPISATDENGNDVLGLLGQKDGVYTPGRQRELNVLNLNLGNLSNAKMTKLVLSAYTEWNLKQLSTQTVNQHSAEDYPGGGQGEIVAQVKDKSGNWVSAFDSEILAPATLPRTYVLNLTGKFLTNDYSVRLEYYAPIKFDFIGVDTTPEQETAITSLPPAYANLHFRGYTNPWGLPSAPDYYHTSLEAPSGYSYPIGNFTRYGDILPLLLDRDDEFAILHHGDEISVSFQNLPAKEGTERDFMLYSWGYFKESKDFVTGGTVDPLPFYGMSAYPYPSNESYPSDAEHMTYLKEYNTRQYEYNASTSKPSEHHSLYSDYVKVDVFTTPMVSSTTTTIASLTPATTSTTTTKASVTSTATTTAVNNLMILMPYLSLIGLIGIISAVFVIRKIRKGRTEKG